VRAKRTSKAVQRQQLAALAKDIVRDLARMRLRIDGLGELATYVANSDRCDMLGCFASNTLYGTQALIEQLMFVAAHPRAKRARWP
jgi:hypothetical protein